MDNTWSATVGGLLASVSDARYRGAPFTSNHITKARIRRALVADAAIGRQCRGRPVVDCPCVQVWRRSEHAVTHSELGCGLTEAVLVDTPCQAAWMAETHPCMP